MTNADRARSLVGLGMTAATGGVLAEYAEYIPARALGIGTGGVRDEWAAHDLTTSSGVKIEVKSAAYMRMASHPSFRISGTRAKAATGSAYDFPRLALANNPASATTSQV